MTDKSTSAFDEGKDGAKEQTDGAKGQNRCLAMLCRQVPLVLFNVVLPIVIYKLCRPYTSEIVAVFLSGVIPMIKILVTVLVFKQHDAVSMMQVLGICISVVITSVATDAKMLLVFQQGGGVIMGLFFLSTLCILREDMAFQLRRTFTTNTTEEMDALYAKPQVRAASRFLTVIWGITGICQALLGVTLVFLLPVDTFIYIANVLGLITLPLLWWSMRYIQSIEKDLDLSSETKPLLV
ncbi:unnamed protein product [Aphanomyces euteiches]|uniref:Uncharacterized protein n=1 Tax=Aphanomyces euteiches TaxID=100861 RepID=A0A6G0WYE3_9STRA|nr:hypothetical protein Ae201684_010280 [Aphanomyces euteiches]KAH9090645.1 hypothetical protein Ae201684P_014440 [Aphanomyces euteiches]KAH9137967.1 hypothetical protein AeRB84_017568 [Aphanomyces euteiches]KAH9137976.1 hypothetical protein AeRB84_017544 [Aphanomyces euteiches]KAH9149548.1 hypothetical protein AeRB84_007403 [Aphanomyces euteiches]